MNPIKTWWYNRNNNAGDFFGPYILDKLNIPYTYDRNSDFLSCGSIAQTGKLNTIIWGSGLHNSTDKFEHLKIKQILAVRGRLTQRYIKFKGLNYGFKCPVGDPGILLSLFYKPTTTKKYKYGIVSHYSDYSDLKELKSDEVPVINMSGNIEEIANRINECEFIFSSSLHGIIFSHSLGIPAIHIENKPLISRDNFKFKDYYSIYNSVKYEKILYNNLDDLIIDRIISNKYEYLPDTEEIDFIKYSLLSVFPYEINNDTINNFMENYREEHYLDNTPLVSIIIPCYNSSKYIKRALDSIPKRNDIEVICIDDGSTDNTLDILNKYKGLNLKVLTNNNFSMLGYSKVINLSAGYCRNIGYDNATGKWIYSLDSDDFLDTEKFNQVLDFKLNSNYDIIYVGFIYNDGKVKFNKTGHPSYFVKRDFLGDIRAEVFDSKNNIDSGKQIRSKLLEKNPLEYTIIDPVFYHYNHPREGSNEWIRTHSK